MAQCPECGGPLAADVTEGLCSKCLMAQGVRLASHLPPPERESEPARLPRSFGDYELIEEIARGGMGMVYRARQRSLDRTVAVKLLHFGPDAGPEQVRRFRTEATAAASLQHPNIVAIHEVGVQQGEQYLVMDLVDGPNLAGFVKDQPLPARRAAGYLKTVAEAIHYAHERGILHRDLKPSNVLMGADDEPRVTDFGLAKRLDGDSSLTLSGHVLGSPGYMPPEQAGTGRGKVGRFSDVYSLGAMLYHMLVGRPPFVGEGLNQTLDQVFNNEPVPPRRLNPAVPRDMETICLKCLEKEPARRYPTAQALADELGRFLRGESIQARQASRPEKVWRWCLRKPALAGLILLVHLVGAVGLAGILWQWRRAQTRGDQLEAASEDLRRNLYAQDIKLAQQALAINNLGLAVELLDKHRPKPGEKDPLRGWEWRYLWQQCQRDDAMSILCRQSNGIASLAVSHDGKWLAVGEEEGGQVSVWDLAGRREVARMTNGTSAALVAFSPMEPLLAMVNGRGVSGEFAPGLQSTVSLWSATSRLPVASFPVGGACRRQILFSGDGQTLVTSERDNGNPIRFRSLPDGRLLTNYSVPFGAGNRGPVWPVATTRDMSVLACGVPGRGLHVVDWASLTKRWSTNTADEVVTLGFSPDGTLLASSSGLGYSAISLWDVRSGERIGTLGGHRGWVSALVFWPDGKTLASASGDQTIRLWDLTDLANIQPAGVLMGHKSEVWSLVLLPDTRTLVSGSKDGSVCVWDTTGLGRGPNGATPLEGVRAWGFTPDSQTLLTVSPRGKVARRHGPDFGKEESLMTVPFNWSALISLDARFVAAAELGRPWVGVWDVAARALVWERGFRDGPHPGAPLRFAADGKRLVVAFANTDLIEEWDLVTDQKTATWRCAVNRGAFFPDERTCLVFRPNGDTALRHLASGHETGLGLEFRQASDAAFSPDGRLLAGASWLGWIRLWDAASWQELATLPGFLQGAYSVGFSPDGRRLVAGSDGREALRLWATDGFHELLTLEGEGSGFVAPTFSPDGNTLSAVNWDGLLHLWRAPSWEEIEAAEKPAQPTGGAR